MNIFFFPLKNSLKISLQGFLRKIYYSFGNRFQKILLLLLSWFYYQVQLSESPPHSFAITGFVKNMQSELFRSVWHLHMAEWQHHMPRKNILLFHPEQNPKRLYIVFKIKMRNLFTVFRFILIKLAHYKKFDIYLFRISGKASIKKIQPFVLSYIAEKQNYFYLSLNQFWIHCK